MGRGAIIRGRWAAEPSHAREIKQATASSAKKTKNLDSLVVPFLERALALLDIR